MPETVTTHRIKAPPLIGAILGLFLSTGCGGSSGTVGSTQSASTDLERVEVMPRSVAISVADEGQQFFAVAMDGSGNEIGGQTFSWSLESAEGDHGSIISGLYHPSALLPDSNVVVVKATSTTDPMKSGFATINLLTGRDLRFDSNLPVLPSGGTVNRPFAVGDRNIAVFDRNVYVVWADNKTGDDDIYLAVGSDRGRFFDNPVRVNDVAPGEQRFPEVTVDLRGDIYIVWEDSRDGNGGSNFDLYFTKGTKLPDGSFSFANSIRVNDDGDQVNEDAGSEHSNPTIAVDPAGNVDIAWEDPRERPPDTDIYFAKGIPDPDGKIIFSKNQRVNRNLAGVSDHGDPSIAVDALGGIYVTWVAFNIHSHIYMAKGVQSNGSILFQDEVRVSDDKSRNALFPSLAVDHENHIYVSWEDFKDLNQDTDIYLAKSTDGGQSFGPNINVSDAPGDQFFPSLSIDIGGHVYIAWEDHRNADADPDIFLAKSADGGNTFSLPTRVNDDTGTAAPYSPSLALDSAGRAFVTWYDARNPCVNSPCPYALFFSMGQ